MSRSAHEPWRVMPAPPDLSRWLTLGSVRPTALVSSRETLHHAVQLLALAGASYLEPRADDSHTSMSWLESVGALATEPLAAAPSFRFALRARELSLVVVEVDSADVSAVFSLQHRTRDEALEWMRREAGRRGLAGNRLLSRLHFAIAPHATDEGGPFERAADGTLEELDSWYGNASLILEATRRRMNGAGPVRCWPHHFDIATLVRLAAAGAMQTIGIGLSPGDESYAEPYYYVSPYPTPPVSPRPLLTGVWHNDGWWGGALAGSEIVKLRTADAQADLVSGFIDGAVERLLETELTA